METLFVYNLVLLNYRIIVELILHSSPPFVFYSYVRTFLRLCSWIPRVAMWRGAQNGTAQMRVYSFAWFHSPDSPRVRLSSVRFKKEFFDMQELHFWITQKAWEAEWKGSKHSRCSSEIQTFPSLIHVQSSVSVPLAWFIDCSGRKTSRKYDYLLMFKISYRILLMSKPQLWEYVVSTYMLVMW